MKDLHELLELCLAKELMFSLSPELNLIKVFQIVDDEYTFNKSAYYDGELKDYTDSDFTTISDLIQKVKEHENK